MIKKIAIMGAGSLGTILGAYLARAGADVTLIDAYEEHVSALNERGAQVTGKAEFRAPVKAVCSSRVNETFDLIFYMAKQTYNETAIPQMIAACKPETVICCCQNGIPEYAVAKVWPEDKICGAPVGWGATFLGPGVSELTSDPARMEFHLGTLDGRPHPWLSDVRSVLEGMCPVVLSDNLLENRWGKLIINAAYSGMSTVTGASFGAVIDDPVGAQCLYMLARETVQAAEAAGVRVIPFGGMDWAAAARCSDAHSRAQAIEKMRESLTPHRNLVASMLQDVRRGKPCEIAHINGVVAETGDRTGVDTPFVDTVIRVVREIEAGARSCTFANLAEFRPLLERSGFPQGPGGSL